MIVCLLFALIYVFILLIFICLLSFLMGHLNFDEGVIGCNEEIEGEQRAFVKFCEKYSSIHQRKFTEREYKDLWRYCKKCGDLNKAENLMTANHRWAKQK